jgi:hypothetical protein
MSIKNTSAPSYGEKGRNVPEAFEATTENGKEPPGGGSLCAC